MELLLPFFAAVTLAITNVATLLYAQAHRARADAAERRLDLAEERHERREKDLLDRYEAKGSTADLEELREGDFSREQRRDQEPEPPPTVWEERPWEREGVQAEFVDGGVHYIEGDHMKFMTLEEWEDYWSS